MKRIKYSGITLAKEMKDFTLKILKHSEENET